MRTRFAGTLIVAFGGVVACGSAGQGGAQEGSANAAGEVVLVGDSHAPGLVEVMEVRSNADGTKSVKKTLITQEQDRLERAQREAFLARSPADRSAYVLTDDGSCAGEDAWLYNYVDGSPGTCPARICFFNGGTSVDYAYLADYSFEGEYILEGMPRCGDIAETEWTDNVASIYPGTQDGCLGPGNSVYEPLGDFDNFGADGAWDATGTAEANGAYLILDYNGGNNGQCYN